MKWDEKNGEARAVLGALYQACPEPLTDDQLDEITRLPRLRIHSIATSLQHNRLVEREIETNPVTPKTWLTDTGLALVEHGDTEFVDQDADQPTDVPPGKMRVVADIPRPVDSEDGHVYALAATAPYYIKYPAKSAPGEGAQENGLAWASPRDAQDALKGLSAAIHRACQQHQPTAADSDQPDGPGQQGDSSTPENAAQAEQASESHATPPAGHPAPDAFKRLAEGGVPVDQLRLVPSYLWNPCADCLVDAFVWEQTPQGRDYWDKMEDWLDSKNEVFPTPPLHCQPPQNSPDTQPADPLRDAAPRLYEALLAIVSLYRAGLITGTHPQGDKVIAERMAQAERAAAKARGEGGE